VPQNRPTNLKQAQSKKTLKTLKTLQNKNKTSKSVIRNKIRRSKGPEVLYVTRNPTPQSLDKIKGIQGIGRGKFLVIIANGPSITQAPLEKLRGIENIDIMSINKPDMRVWPTQYWAFFDRSQLNRHKDLWDNYSGYVFNSTAIKEQKPKSMQFKNFGGKGFSTNLDKGIHIGRSSVYAAIQIANWMDYDKIFIFGCDMNPEGIDGKLHFYGTNPDVEPQIRASRFEAEASYYNIAAETLGQKTTKFYFCSKGINPWPFVNHFPQLEHEKAVDCIIKLSTQL
jgi:hypothetical protein